MQKQVNLALCGAGMRGQFAYAPYALKNPGEAKFVAVAEPVDALREKFAREHGIAPEHAFRDYRELLSRPALCEALMICTMDNDHVEPALMALDAGYRHILLEKPIDKDVAKCAALVEAAKAVDANVQVCHSLRYTRFYRRLREVIEGGKLGRVVNIAHVEGVGFFHQAHSFVRGNWANSDETSPMILQKCCHDTDLLLYLVGNHCLSVSSYGSLSFFKQENAPVGSAARCVDCAVRDECPYNATAIYGEGGRWNGTLVAEKEGFASLDDMLLHGRYGRCAFRCGNNVVDHQVVNMLFEDGVTASMTMSAFSHIIGRETRIMCTHGEIYANLEESTIRIHEFGGGDEQLIKVSFGASGHSGADELMVREFLGSVRGEMPPVTEIALSVESHRMAMAAEASMNEGRTVAL